MKVVLITNTYFETNAGGTAVPLFVGGQHYPLTEDSLRQVARRNGEEVDAPEGWVAPGDEVPEPEADAQAEAAVGAAAESPAAKPAAAAKAKRGTVAPAPSA